MQVALLLWVRRRARRHRAAAAGGQRTAARLACTAAAPVPAAPETAATGTAAGRRGAGGEAARPVCECRVASALPHARRRNRTAAPTAQATQVRQGGHGSPPGGLLGQADKRCARQERGPPQLPCCHHGATQQQLLGQAIEPNFVRWPIASAQEGQGLDAQARTQTPPLLATDSTGGASSVPALGAVFWQPVLGTTNARLRVLPPTSLTPLVPLELFDRVDSGKSNLGGCHGRTASHERMADDDEVGAAAGFCLGRQWRG